MIQKHKVGWLVFPNTFKLFPPSSTVTIRSGLGFVGKVLSTNSKSQAFWNSNARYNMIVRNVELSGE